MDPVFSDDKDQVVKQCILKQLASRKDFVLDGHALYGLTVEKYTDELVNQIIYSVRTMIPAEDMKEATHTVCVNYPDGWWNAFKYQYFPTWLIKRYPIKYITKRKP